MPPTAPATTIGATREPGPRLRWRNWPLVDEGYRALVVVILLAAVGGIVTIVSGQLHWGLLAIVAVMAAIWRFFVPTLYEISDTGVLCRFLGRGRFLPWQSIGAVEHHHQGLLLLREPRSRTIDILGGLFIPCGPLRDEAVRLVQHYAPWTVEEEKKTG